MTCSRSTIGPPKTRPKDVGRLNVLVATYVDAEHSAIEMYIDNIGVGYLTIVDGKPIAGIANAEFNRYEIRRLVKLAVTRFKEWFPEFANLENSDAPTEHRVERLSWWRVRFVSEQPTILMPIKTLLAAVE